MTMSSDRAQRSLPSRFLFPILLASSLAVASFSVHAADPRSAPAFAGARVSVHAQTGQVRFVGTQPGKAVPLGYRPGQGRPEDYGLAIASEHGSVFGITNASEQLKLRKSRTKPQGGHMLRYQQMHRGIPVFAGELIINLDHGKALKSMNGEISPNLDVSVVPTLGPQKATDIALQAVSKWYSIDVAKLGASDAELTIYDARLLKPSAFPPKLVWRLEIASIDLLTFKELVLVDAHSGSINLHFNQIHSAKYRKTYSAFNTSVLPGALFCEEGDPFPNCAAFDQDIIDAHTYAGDTYDFYLSTHGRDGIDDTGGILISTVHYEVNYQNAFWNGTQMAYGDGYAGADDVVGHELTHGVTNYESDLQYYYQSGAISESLSDIWGEFIDLANGGGSDSEAARWLIGEDLPSGSIRNMKNPPAFDQPDRMTHPNYWRTSLDNGGVHINSGVGNKAAYLMTDGDTFNGKTVRGLGIDKTAKIFYEVQTSLLTSGSDYADLYDYLYQGCLNLVGSSGIITADCDQVRTAADAVEMNLDPDGDPNYSPDAALCPPGQVQGTVLFADDLEANANNWSTATLTGTANPWYWVTYYATSGTRSFHNYNIDTLTDSVVWNWNPISLPSGAYLHFRHAFAFDTSIYYWDGGVVEFSLDAGANWFDLGPGFDDGQAYVGTIYSSFGNPLGGRAAFAGESRGYVSSRYDLSPLAGQNFQVRFRAASDSLVGAYGWVVDDVSIYQCEEAPNNPPQAPNNPSPANSAVNVAVTKTLSWSGGDPDGDAVTYDVWLEAGDATPDVLVCNDVATTICDPTGDLLNSSTYYWKVVATDEHGAETSSPIWSFNTVAAANLTLIKHLPNDNGGTATADQFQAYIDGNPVSWNTPIALQAGQYVVSEDTLPGYEPSGWFNACAANGAITLAPGDAKTCEIINDDVSDCGNGILDPGEQCDDGNAQSGDGCSATCQIEPGYSCTDPQPPVLTNLLQDPSFEHGPPHDAWNPNSTNFGTPICDASCGIDAARTGSWYVWFGGYGGGEEEASVSQTLVIPDTATELRLYKRLAACDSGSDFAELLIDGNQLVIQRGDDPSCGELDYAPVAIDISAYADNAAHTITLHSVTYSVNGGPTTMFVDDLWLPQGPLFATPGICQETLLFRDGFEGSP